MQQHGHSYETDEELEGSFSGGSSILATPVNRSQIKMDKVLKAAAETGDVTILDRIRKGELTMSDSQFLSFDSTGYYNNFIHHAMRCGQEVFIRKVFKVLKPEVLVKLIFHQNVFGSTCLHAGVVYGCFDTVKFFVDFYRSWSQNEGNSTSYAKPPWLVASNAGYTPLHDALVLGHDDFACYLFSLDPASLYDQVDKEKRSPLFLALEKQCDKFLKLILEHDFPVTNAFFSGSDGKTALHQAIIKKKEESLVKQLLQKIDGKGEIIWKKDSKGWTALHYAAASGEDWQVQLLLERPPASNFFMFDQDSDSPLRLAWESGRYSTAEIILRCFPMMIECRGVNNTTLLHHIKLQSREEYQRILQIPETQRVLNITDSNGMTPLHQAITDSNFLLTELLFENDGVKKDIANKEGKTPINLLIEKSHQSREFGELSKRPGIIPRGTYLAYGADLKEVRSSVMVVAALLATITFQAAFTIPDAIKTSTAVFVIFFISIAFAMCSSLVVLFWLIWAMVEDDIEKSRKLADRSFFVLGLSFYGTLGAFAAAAFAIASDKSLSLAIGVTVLCFFVPVLSNKTISSNLFKEKGMRTLPWYLCSTYCYQNSRSQTRKGTGIV